MRVLPVEIIRVLLLLLFSYTATAKFLHFPDFQEGLRTLPLIGKYYLFISYGVLISLAAVSLLLLIPRSVYTGLWFSFVLLLVFTAYIASMLLFTNRIPCHCVGIFKNISWPQHLLLNTGLSLLGAGGIALFRTSSKVKVNTQEIR